MLGIGGGAHEIALRFTSLDLSGDVWNPLWGRLARGGNEALGWKSLLPQLDGAVSLSRLSSFITTFLVFAVVALIIMNTLFMSLSERIYEFGILRAIGTRPLRMAGLIVLEAASLSVVSIAIGLAIGLGAVLFFGHVGIDYTGIDFAEVTITERIYPIPRWSHLTLDPLLIFMFSVVASLYPAFYAARLRPALALRRSL
jgi:ABC-type lipoprotein release transport system permease subunit